MKVIESYATNRGSVQVKHDHIDNEYRVEVYRGGKLYTPATYFTEDKQDALGTAKHMIAEENKATA